VILKTYPNVKDELMILRRGSMTSGSISFRSLVGVGSNTHVVDLDDLTSLVNSLLSNKIFQVTTML